jgi:hypothetical protein
MNWKDHRRKRWWLDLKYYPSICLEEVKSACSLVGGCQRFRVKHYLHLQGLSWEATQKWCEETGQVFCHLYHGYALMDSFHLAWHLKHLFFTGQAIVRHIKLHNDISLQETMAYQTAVVCGIVGVGCLEFSMMSYFQWCIELFYFWMEVKLHAAQVWW